MVFFYKFKHFFVRLLITAAKLGTGVVDEVSIVKALELSLQKIIEEGKSHTESINWNFIIASLSGCFENFECGLKALEQCINIVFPYACASLNKYVTELGYVLSITFPFRFFNFLIFYLES